MGGAVSFARRPSDAGMTLIEMLIVLAIIGVAAGAVTLGIGAATRKPTAETEARRLAARLQAAADAAMLGDRRIAFTVERNGYSFATVPGTGPALPQDDRTFGFHRLPSAMTMTIDTTPPVVLGVDGSGRPMSAIIEAGSQRWRVAYDGMTVSAIPMPAA